MIMKMIIMKREDKEEEDNEDNEEDDMIMRRRITIEAALATYVANHEIGSHEAQACHHIL